MQRFAELLRQGLLAAGHEVQLVCPPVRLGRLRRGETGLGKWLGYIDRFLLYPSLLRQQIRWADVVHICDQANAVYIPHLGSTPHVLTCHDMLAIRAALGEIPESKPGLSGRLYQRWILDSLRKAQWVVCVSTQTRDEVARIVHLPGDRLVMVPNGLNYPYRPMQPEAAAARLQRLGLEVDTPFVLHVGGNQWYKNRPGVLRIFAELVKHPGFESYRLVMAGKPWTDRMRQVCRRLGMDQRAHEWVDVSNEDLCALYSTAAAFLFPSLQEGYGWPVAEAQSCGCLVVASNRAPMTEVGGAAAIYIDPADESAAAGIIAHALAAGGATRSAGLDNAARFSSEAMIDGYLACYRRSASTHPASHGDAAVVTAACAQSMHGGEPANTARTGPVQPCAEKFLPPPGRPIALRASTMPLRILRIIPSLDPKGGGPTEGARKIDAELLALGHSVEVACLDAPGAAFHATYPAPVHALGPTRMGSYRYAPRLVPWLRDSRQRYDAIIVNGLWQYHGLGAWRALAGTQTPYVVFTHGMLDPWFKRTYPLKHFKKWLYWPWAEYRLLRDAKAVIFTSEEERLLARESFWLYRCNEVVTAYGTAAPAGDAEGLKAAFLSRHPHLQGKRLLLFLSRIHEKKGCDLLVSAFAQVAASDPDLQLVMAGPDQTGWVANLKDQAERLGIAERVSWPGMLQGDDKWGAFYAAEVFCLPSHQENFGIVVAEALACGKPVLISNKVNIWREIEADGVGIVHDDTLEGTLRGLQQWLALTPPARLQMQQSARPSFDARFRIDRVAASLVNILQRHVAMPAATDAVNAGVEH